MTTKHTPGPWQADADSPTGPEVIIGGWIVRVGANDLEVAKANAHLIAAAPETAAERDRLKAALEQIAYSDFSADIARAKARAAIESKA